MDDLPITPYREIGLAFDGPSCLYTISNKAYLLAATQKSYKVYSLPGMKVKLLGPSLAEPIDFVHAWNEATFVFAGGIAYRFHFQHVIWQREVGRLAAVVGAGPELFLLCEDGTVQCLDAELNLVDSFHAAIVVGAVHPPTYVNKLLLFGSKILSLYNVRSKALVFDFLSESEIATLFESQTITVGVAAAQVDVVALGCESGLVVVLNLRTAAVLATFTLDNAITALAFVGETLFGASPRFFAAFDVAAGALRLLRSAAPYSALYALDCEEQRLLVAGSAASNALHVYAFDGAVPRLLRIRQAAARPIVKLRFFGDRTLVALTENAIIRFSLRNDSASVALSDRKRGPNTELSLETSNAIDFALDAIQSEREGPQMFTLHAGSALPVAWDVKNARRAPFFVEKSSATRFHADPLHASWVARTQSTAALSLSAGAAFLFLAYSDGSLIKLSAQSGAFQGAFRPAALPPPVVALEAGGRGAVWAVAANCLIALDAYSGATLFREEIGRVDRAFFDPQNELALLSSAEGVRVFNCTSRRTGPLLPAGELLDVAFLPSARKALWSEKSGKLVFVDALFSEVQFEYKLPKAIVSMTVNEELRVLCTVSEGQREISLWNISGIAQRLSKPSKVCFQSPLQHFPKSLRAHYLRPSAPAELITEKAREPLAEAVAAFCLANEPPANFSNRDAAYIRALRYADANRGGELSSEMVIEEPTLPFFLDFGAEKSLSAVSGSKRVSAIEDNQLLAAHLSAVERTLAEASVDGDNTAIFIAVSEQLDRLSAAEIDCFLKKTAFFHSEEIVKTFFFLRFLLEKEVKLDLAHAMIAAFLPAASRALLSAEANPAIVRPCIEAMLTAMRRRRDLPFKALQLQAVCENIARGSF